MLKKLLLPIFLLGLLCFGMSVYAARQNGEPTYRYKLSIAAIFKNETFFMKEWIEYHRMVGVEHFLLYNNNSTDNWQEILAPYIKEGLVEVIDWPYTYDTLKFSERAQALAYQDSLTRYAGVSRWVALIDLDEFLFPKMYVTVTELLDKQFSSVDAICVSWRLFGTSYKNLTPEDSVLCSLTKASDKDNKYNSMVKSIVRPEAVDWENSTNIHWYVLKDGYVCVDGHGLPYHRQKRKNGFGSPICTNYFQLNHYKMGDEWYWHTIKKPRLLNSVWRETWLWAFEQYELCNHIEDVSMIDFIKAYHPKEYELLWKDGKFKRDFYHA